MVIEFTGCTGSGKSTISSCVTKELEKSGVSASLFDVGGKFKYDFIALPWFIWFAVRNIRFCLFATSTLMRYTDSKITALNIYRNFIKKIGFYQLIQMKNNQKHFVFDEGPVHTFHNLFVHVNSIPRVSDITNFAYRVPMPDLLVYIRAPFETIISRTIRRGHRRAGNDENDVRAFVANAIASLEILVSLDVIKERLIIVENADSNFSQIDKIAKSIAKQILSCKQCYS